MEGVYVGMVTKGHWTHARPTVAYLYTLPYRAWTLFRLWPYLALREERTELN